MRVPLIKRLIVAMCNIFFPPLAVALITGWASRDTFINAILFLLAVIPSHIHGLYISLVYFTRKRRARNGKFPGKQHSSVICSEKVLTGGLGWKGAEALKPLSRAERKRQKRQSASRGGSRRNSDVETGVVQNYTPSRQSSRRTNGHGYTDMQVEEATSISRVGSQVSRTSRHF